MSTHGRKVHGVRIFDYVDSDDRSVAAALETYAMQMFETVTPDYNSEANRKARGGSDHHHPDVVLGPPNYKLNSIQSNANQVAVDAAGTAHEGRAAKQLTELVVYNHDDAINAINAINAH